MQKILSADGEHVSELIEKALVECYQRLARNGVSPETYAHIRGEVIAYEFALNAMGRSHDVNVEISEGVGKNGDAFL